MEEGAGVHRHRLSSRRVVLLNEYVGFRICEVSRQAGGGCSESSTEHGCGLAATFIVIVIIIIFFFVYPKLPVSFPWHSLVHSYPTSFTSTESVREQLLVCSLGDLVQGTEMSFMCLPGVIEFGRER